MISIQEKVSEVKARPVATGIFAVLAVLSVGMALAFAAGLTNPVSTHAQVAGPPCCTPTPPPPPSTPPPPPAPPAPTPAPVPAPVLPPAPKCVFLSASSNSLTAPGTVTLSWKTSDASSESIDNGVGSVSGSTGSKTVSVTKTTTYKLSISNSSGSDNCTTTVTIVPPKPVCTLVASQTSIAAGGASTLTWTTQNATSASISGVGSVTPVSGGSTSVSPTKNTTYTLTATGAGGTVTCPASITITTPSAPVCTLSASQTSFTGPGTSILSWTTKNAVSFAIDNSVGAVTPVAAGSKSVSVTKTITYTGTATSATGEVAHCTVPITVTTTTPKPACTLAISKSSIAPGDTATLSWTTSNATSASIDNGVGTATPVAGGSKDVTPTKNTTYLLTAIGSDGSTVTCSAPITVSTTPAPACTLTADDTSLSKGDSTKLNWTSTHADTVTIDQSIGSVTPVAGGSTTVSPSSDTTYTATATGPYGTKTCSVTITVSTPGCTSNCGGGGGGGHHGGSSSKPVVTLVGTSTAPLSYVYLSQIPYTGLDLGTFGTIVYWLGLILWSLALAYLALFKLFPYAVRRISAFGMEVGRAVNGPVHDAHADHGAHGHVPAPSAHAAYSAPAPMPHVDPIVMPHTDPIISDMPRATGYSAYDGFRSFAPATEPLSIDDIVKGLSREPYRAPAPAPMPMHEAAHVAEAPREERMVAPAPKPAPAAPRAVDVDPVVPAFLGALLGGDREKAFGMLRETVKSGANAEDFLAQIACALDDAYRARTEGAPVNAEVKRMTDGIATPVLERLVTSLTTAVDSTYSVGITGAKLAVARALATLGA